MKRNVNKEQYYTHNALAKECVVFLFTKLDKNAFDLFLEPSAGRGAFYDLLPTPKKGIDVDPKHPEVEKIDFFDYEPPVNVSILTVGNPPFGARASLALKFLKRSMSFSKAVAFILPRSFNKNTFQDSLPLNFHLVDSFDCDDFELENGEPLKIKCVFQIWEKRNYCREKFVKLSHSDDFELKHVHWSRISDEQKQDALRYDFAIPQVGSYKKTPVSQICAGSHWLVKMVNVEFAHVFDHLDFSFLDETNTVFRSLSRHDIIFAYNEAKKLAIIQKS